MDSMENVINKLKNKRTRLLQNHGWECVYIPPHTSSKVKIDQCINGVLTKIYGSNMGIKIVQVSLSFIPLRAPRMVVREFK
jgi:hypothetical protein